METRLAVKMYEEYVNFFKKAERWEGEADEVHGKDGYLFTSKMDRSPICAKVVEAEAEVPRAIADAFRDGKLGIMDYYKLRNVQADTDMRKSIAGMPVNK
jgi:choline dehydrogenase-like flavoprotein